ncbi:ABC transporter permease [Thioclava sp. FR2]|uniref:ABC transporter permease n=1 Tax=Thioclava sp. FR2 TaxID=3445780 RepID=UPI003EBF8384
MLSTLVSFVLAMVIVSSLTGSRAFSVVQHMLAPLLAVPHAAAALGIAFLIAPSGWIARAISPWLTGWELPPDALVINDPGGWALIVGLIAKELPFLLLMTLAALPQTDATRRILQTQTLGAGKTVSFLVAVLPSLYKQLRLPVYAVLAYSMTTVEMAMILGPNLPPPLSVQIVVWMNEASLANRGTAAGAALFQLLAVILAIGGWRISEWAIGAGFRYFVLRGLRARWLDIPGRALGIVFGLGFSAFLFLGLAGLAVWSFAVMWPFPQAWPSDLSAKTWMQTGAVLFERTRDTFLIAVWSASVALALVLACLEAEHRYQLVPNPFASAVLYLPLIIPQIGFLPGLQLFALWFGLDGTRVAVAAVHLIFVLPYVYLSLSGPFRSVDPRLGLVAASLGATPRRAFWAIRLPVLLRPILTAFAVGLAVSIGQYLPTLLTGGGRVVTLTTEAVALSSGGNRRIIGAYGLAQSLLPVLGFALALIIPNLVFRNRRDLQTKT